MDFFKGKLDNEGYDAHKPDLCSYGRQADILVYIEDSTLELCIELGYDHKEDEVTIESIEADYTNCNGGAIDTTDMKLEQMVVDIFKHYDTFSIAYMRQADEYAEGRT